MKKARRVGVLSLSGRLPRWAGWLCVLGCIAVLATAVGAGILRGHAQEAFPLPAIDPPKTKTAPTPVPADQNKQQTAATPANTTDKRQIASESADLLKMATALKAEVDKTTRDTLSVTVVRKADEIEQFAHKVRTGTGKS